MNAAGRDVFDPGGGNKLMRSGIAFSMLALLMLPAGGAPAAELTQTFRGLLLRTHPDYGAAASKVFLVHADEVVLDDGVRVPDWNNLTADVTVAGAGGLDTGVEAPATWYEIHVIRKSGDAARSLLLHRAKAYRNDQTQPGGAADERLRDSSERTKLAQSMESASGGSVEFIDVSIGRKGSPAGSLWLTVEADAGGSPAGAALATSDKLDVSKLAATATFVRFIFRAPPALKAGGPYYVVLNSDFPIDGSSSVAWTGNASDVYAKGSAMRFNGTAWSPAAVVRDFTFRVYVTERETPVSMPAGYDQKAKIGYVYNNSDGHFDGFVAMDHRVMPLLGAGVSAFANDTPVLFDLSRSIPPGPIRLELSGSNEAPGARVAAQPVPMGFDASPAGGFTRSQGGQASGVVTVGSAGPSVLLGSVVTEYQACYFFTTGRLARAFISMWEW